MLAKGHVEGVFRQQGAAEMVVKVAATADSDWVQGHPEDEKTGASPTATGWSGVGTGHWVAIVF